MQNFQNIALRPIVLSGNNMIILTLSRLILLLILMLSIVFPTALQGVKMILLMLVMGVFVLCAATNPSKMQWNKHIVLWAIAFSTIGLLWSLYGLFRGNPGALRVLTVMSIYPVLFTLLGYFWRPGDAERLQKSFLWFGFILVISIFFYLGSSMVLDGGTSYRFMESLYGDDAVVNQGEDYLLFTLPSVASLLFFLPFCFFNLIFSPKYDFKNLILLVFIIIIVFLTGRRAIYFSFAVTVILVFGIIATGRLFFPGRLPNFPRGRLMCLSLGLAVIMISVVSMELQNIEIFFSDLNSIFDFHSDASNLERTYQFDALAEGIEGNVVFGSGAGAAAGYSRSFEQPWAYELFYMAIIFQYGFIVSLVYISGILYLVWGQLKCIGCQSLKYESRLFSLCFFSGFISFLIATATNPYLGKFDYMWVIFIPVIMINSFKLTKQI